jgi:hypothetical protein
VTTIIGAFSIIPGHFIVVRYPLGEVQHFGRFAQGWTRFGATIVPGQLIIGDAFLQDAFNFVVTTQNFDLVQSDRINPWFNDTPNQFEPSRDMNDKDCK